LVQDRNPDSCFGLVVQRWEQRSKYPARGRNGGGPGGKGSVRLASGAELGSKGLQVVPAGDRLIESVPGVGMSAAAERDWEPIGHRGSGEAWPRVRTLTSAERYGSMT